MSLIVARYSDLLKRYPGPVNALTGFVIASTGDVAAQVWEQRNHQHDRPVEIDAGRTVNLGLIRLALISPFISFWYPFLSSRFSTSLWKKLACDQIVGAPIVISTVFVASSLLRDGHQLPSLEKMKTDGFAAWGLGLRYWPLVHCITFGILPLRHQQLFAHLASVPWMAVLSHHSTRSQS
jgi:Mpv17 / PMP22 family